MDAEMSEFLGVLGTLGIVVGGAVGLKLALDALAPRLPERARKFLDDNF